MEQAINEPCANRAAPRVSIVSCFYNAEAFLAEAIESVLSQTFSDWELILVDDASPDRSREIAEEYVRRYGKRISCLSHPDQLNHGPSQSRNLGISSARGEFVAFIDADDVWAPEKLEEQVALMDAHPEVGMVCGAVRYWSSWAGGRDVVRPTGHVCNRVVRPPEAALALDPLGDAIAASTDMMVRLEAVARCGGYDERFVGPYALHEDQTLPLKLYLSVPVYFSDRVWLSYRQRADSLSTTEVRKGRYRASRRFLLQWLDQHTTQSPELRDPRVGVALDRALDAYRRPWLHGLRRVGARLSRLASSAKSGVEAGAR